MSYSDDAVNAKLASLNETQDSIVAVAQWIMFHRRHADRTASIWLARLQEATTLKRLNLIYLANEVVQQSRARSKTDFLYSFEPIISDAMSTAYKGASMEVQHKLKRVVEVWRQRSIFDSNIQSTIEKRIEEVDKQRGGTNGLGKSKLGGSLFGSGGGSVVPELEAVNKALTAAGKAEISTKTSIPAAETEYNKMTDPSTAVPTPPVHAARLNSLLKTLATAQNAVEGCLKERRVIVAGLEKLLEQHKSKLSTEEEQASALRSKAEQIENKKKEVEDHIMQGLSTPEATRSPAVQSQTEDPVRPETEGFTPPPPDVEAFTPPLQAVDTNGNDSFLIGDASVDERLLSGPTGAETIQEQPVDHNEPAPTSVPPIVLQGQTRQASSELTPEVTQDPRLKRRKTSHPKATDVDEDIFGASMGIDEAGVSALLGN